MTTYNILVLSPFERLPLSQGSIVRTWHLARYLAQQHNVWFACRGRKEEQYEVTPRVIENSPNRFAQLFNPFFFWRLWRLVRREEIDLIVISQFWAAIHGLLLKLTTGRPLLFDNHNVEFRRLRRMGSPFWPLAFLLEFVTCRVADRVQCVSETDCHCLARAFRLAPAKLQVVNNGVDVATFRKQPRDRDAVRRELGVREGEKMLLYVGSLTHRPNAQAVDVILDELVPRLMARVEGWRIVIVGLGAEGYLQQRADPPPDKVTFAGFVDDIVPVLHGADMVIVPLTAGSGTRYKILEAAACGKRVISTGVGAEGLREEIFGESLLICNDWDSFAEQIAVRLEETFCWEPTAAFIQTYDWQHVFSQIDLGKIAALEQR